MGGFFVRSFPNQEPRGTGPPLQKNPKIDKFWDFFFMGGPLPVGSSFGNQKTLPPRGGGFFRSNWLASWVFSIVSSQLIAQSHCTQWLHRVIEFEDKWARNSLHRAIAYSCNDGWADFWEPDNPLVHQSVAVCCSVLQCVAVCCSVLQCVAVSSVVARTQNANDHEYI